jgi:uncharacterized membrane protein YphA (DoxX/SURF4 family)
MVSKTFCKETVALTSLPKIFIMSSSRTITSWVLRAIAAIIMLQTLFFKFTAASESVYIFSTLGIEPWGRIGSGIMELIASVLILIPRTTVLGALLAIGIMGGAILSHIFFLGIAVQGDGGQLFIYALLVLISAAILFWTHRHQLGRFLPQRFIPFRITHS